jgi:hypothetical protein
VKPADEVEQELTAGLRERQVAQLVENDEVHASQMFGESALPTIAGLGLKPVDEIDDVVEPSTGTIADATSRDRDGQMGLAGACSTDQHDVALLGDEAATGEIIDGRLVDRRAVELEVVNILGKRQLGDGELVLDRPSLLLVDLGGEQITDDALRLMLPLDGGRHDLVEGGLHSVKLELTHEVEDLGSFHQMVCGLPQPGGGAEAWLHPVSKQHSTTARSRRDRPRGRSADVGSARQGRLVRVLIIALEE